MIEKLFLFPAGIPYKGAVTPLCQDQTPMRAHAFALAALLITAPFVTATLQIGRAQAQESVAAATEACMKEIRSGLKAGQKMTEQQRMVAETQCRVRAEQSAQPVKK
jgi:hypothetical protein